MFPLSGFENNCAGNSTDGEDSFNVFPDKRKSTEPYKSHKEAERRRRQRINAHLSTLRSLLPTTTKTDKASLLAEVVHRVRELRRQVDDVVARRDVDGFCGGDVSQPELEFPGEFDEAALSFCDEERKLLKATVCCEDRPGLNRDLSRVIKSVQARVVRAEMATVGGRTKSVVVMQWGGSEGEVGPFKRALKDVVDNRVSGLAAAKRARAFGSDDEKL